MATTSADPPLVPLRLPSREQWVLHHVLVDRIERSRRYPWSVPPPPREIREALRKLESGSLLFTVPELQRVREALAGYLRTGSVAPGERREIGRVARRVDEALSRRRLAASR